MATATTAAGAGIEIAFLGDAAEFKSLADALRDGTLHLLHFLLGIEKAAGDGIGQKAFAELLKGRNFTVSQSHAGMLSFMEGFALLHQCFVLAAGRVVGHEGLDVFAPGADFRLFENGLAEFAGFLGDCGFFGVRVHNDI
jgi:hypothetical protein